MAQSYAQKRRRFSPHKHLIKKDRLLIKVVGAFKVFRNRDWALLDTTKLSLEHMLTQPRLLRKSGIYDIRPIGAYNFGAILAPLRKGS